MFKLFNRKRVNTQEEAQVQYEALVRNVQELMGTNGFKELVLWWEREYERLEVEIDKCEDEKRVFDLTRERKIVKKHYLFMKNLATARE